jgi:decaprenylphospho-beta-D-erythro-pentofuranosid-2-ulose 2-reductase
VRRILIMGATSAIAEATARVFARRGDALLLVGRSAERLQAIAADLKVRGAAIAEYQTQDAIEMDRFPALLDSATAALGGLDTALIAHGTLSDQKECEASLEALLQEFTINALSVMALCTLLANRFAEQKHGTIAVISSVAGDRGRQSNYVYGSAKAAISAFTSGMRQRLHSQGVRVVTIKPGFVDTPMTAAFRKGLLWASPATAARYIARAMIRGTPVVYVPWFWRPIMAIIRAVPEFIFRRLRL